MTSPDPQPIATLTLEGYLTALNSKSPTPGGGAVAGTTGATAAAIAGMVIHYTLGKAKYSAHESSNANDLAWITGAQSRFLVLADDDARGYGVLNALWTLPESDPTRRAGWDDAVAGAITPPTSMLSLSDELMQRIHALIERTNRQLRSDLGVAAIVCRAAGHSAACNIRVNVPLLAENQRERVLHTTQTILDRIDSLSDQTQRECR